MTRSFEARTSPAGLAGLILRLVEPRVLGPLAGAVFVLVTAVVIHRLSGEIHLDDVMSAVAATPWSKIFAALGFTIVSFIAMAFYDVMAARQVAPGRVSPLFAFQAGLIGYGISNAIGFHVFVGGPVRFRLYGAAGLDAADVGRIVGVSFMTFSMGMAAISAGALLVDPIGIPALHFLTPSLDRIVGVAIVIALTLLIAWLWTSPREITVVGWRFTLPSGPSATVQMAIGAIDIGTACAALYVLLPADVVASFATFLAIFVMAIILGVVSHAPGGLGVLEATVMIGLGATGRADVLGALLVFRIVYYLIPLALAGTAMLALEAYRAREKVANLSGRTLAVTRRVVAPVAGTLVVLGGLVLLLSANTPAEGSRMDYLRDFVPLPFAEASHMLSSLIGLLLIVLARGLFRRIALARTLSILFLVAGALFSIAKGLDWEEATILLAIAAMLAVSRDIFYRTGDWRSFRPTPVWLSLVMISVVALTLIGFLAFQHVEYSSQLWWQFAWEGDAPRFLRATVALGVVAVALAADALINRPVQPRIDGEPVPNAVREVLAQTGATQPLIALLGDKRFILSAKENAFLMFGVAGSSWITMGDPVGDAKAAHGLIWRFAEKADKAGARAVFYAVGPNLLPAYLDLGLAVLKIGEIARVDLREFSLDGSKRQNFRYAARKAKRDGLEFAIVPKVDVPTIMAELRAVSDAWLATKKGHEKGFSLGRFDENYLLEFDFAVMRDGGGRIVAFGNLWRGADRCELSIDLMRYRPGVSSVMMEAFFANLLLYGKDEGYHWFNLGAAPLSGLVDHPLASTWNRLGTLIYRWGDEFYNFEGLRAFKEKFSPQWTPQYLACRGGFALPQILIDVASVISGGPLGIIKR